MSRPDHDDTRQTVDQEAAGDAGTGRQAADVEAVTVRIGGGYTDDDDLAPLVRGRRRSGFALWLPLVIFAALLVGAGVVAQFVVPRVESGATGTAPTRSTAAAIVPVQPPTAVTPSLPDLPTPPPRPADALSGWAGRVASVTDVPLVAAQAYGYAQLLLQREKPGCHLGWTTLAGIGKVESDHGRAGALLGANGRSTPPINGPALDGKDGRALVKDTDGGAYDNDPVYDHEMGPMHLLPLVWGVYKIDADGDGILDPYDIDDASATLARYLCSANQDLNTLPGWTAALAQYHPGDTYENAVFRAADSYGQLTRSIG